MLPSRMRGRGGGVGGSSRQGEDRGLQRGPGCAWPVGAVSLRRGPDGPCPGPPVTSEPQDSCLYVTRDSPRLASMSGLWLSHSPPDAEAPEEGGFVSGQQGPEASRLSWDRVPAARQTPGPTRVLHRSGEMRTAGRFQQLNGGVICYTAEAAEYTRPRPMEQSAGPYRGDSVTQSRRRTFRKVPGGPGRSRLLREQF